MDKLAELNCKSIFTVPKLFKNITFVIVNEISILFLFVFNIIISDWIYITFMIILVILYFYMICYFVMKIFLCL